MCQKLSPKWCFLDGQWPPKGRIPSWVPPHPLAILGGVAGNLGLDRGPSSSASPLPTATTASRFYRIDRAQVSTRGLLQKLPAPGPRVTCPAWPSCTAGHTCVCRWAVHRDGADGRELGTWGWLVGSLKAQASSSLTLKERCFGSVAGAPSKGLAVGRGCKLGAPCMRSGDLGQEGRGGGGVGWGLLQAWLPQHCSTSRPWLLQVCWPGIPLHPTSAALQGPDPRPNLPPQPRRNTSTT